MIALLAWSGSRFRLLPLLIFFLCFQLTLVADGGVVNHAFLRGESLLSRFYDSSLEDATFNNPIDIPFVWLVVRTQCFELGDTGSRETKRNAQEKYFPKDLQMKLTS